MIDLGKVKPGSTIRIPFTSFDKDDGSAITMTNYAVADILIYKDGSTTERASTAGFTATTDFDAKTGKHLAIIDLADNTTAGFYSSGSEYLVALDVVTIDAVTTGGWIARFKIGMEGADLETTIATLATQTSFTLTVGPAEDDAINGAEMYVHDVASSVQSAYGTVLDYTGSTKTVTLAAAPTYTMATTDNVSFFRSTSLMKLLGSLIPTPTVAGVPNVNAKTWNDLTTVALPLVPTTAGRTLTVDATNHALADVDTIKTNPVVNGGTITFPTTATLASTTNIAAGTVTTLTGHTPQTGDSFARIGATGSGLTSLASQATADLILTDTGTDIPAQISGIGTAGGAAVNVDATTDNSAGGISGVTSATTKVGTETGTFANLVADDGNYHVITHAGNAIDWVYQFLTGGGTNPVNVTWKGYLTGANDTITFYAWNHVGGAWEALGTQIGQSGTVDVLKTIILFPRHRGTSSGELGKVYIRLACTAMTAPVLNSNQIYHSYAITSRSVGYANGAVWVDTTNGVAGTESFVNGTADYPVLTIADALTIASANKLKTFDILNGSTITLAATFANKIMEGHEWTLALGGQNIASSMFIDADVSGTSSGTLAEFEDCVIGAITISASQYYLCGFNSTFTLGATGDYLFVDCFSFVAGTGAPVFDFGALGATTASFRRWSGGMTINNIASGDVISVDCVSGGTITLNGADGNVQVRGMCTIVDNRTGTPTLGRDNNMDYRFDVMDTAHTDIQSRLTTAQADLDTITGSNGVIIASGTQTFNMTGNITGNLSGSVGSVTGAVGSVTGAVGSVTGAVGSVTGAVGSVTGNLGGNVLGTVATVNALAANVITAASIADGAIDRATFAADTGLQSFRSNTAQAGAAGNLTLDASASSVTSFYVNDLLILTGGTGVGQARYITAYDGTTKVATVNSNWKTTPDVTTTFAVIGADAIVGATAPTAAQVASAVWTDTTASDFTTALSVGKSVMNGVALGTGLTVARTTLTDTLTTYTGNTVQTGDSFARIGVAGAGLTNIDLPNQTMDIVGNITGNLSGSVGSVTGAVGSVTGSVGSVTGAVGSVTGAVGSVTGNLGGNVVGSVASVVGAVGSVAGLTASNLDATVSSRATPAQILTTALTEAYAADGAAGTLTQILYFIQQVLTEMTVSGTTATIKKLDGATTAATLTLSDATNPTSITRAS